MADFNYFLNRQGIRGLQGVKGDQVAGETVEARLPNIIGEFFSTVSRNVSGAFYQKSGGAAGGSSSSGSAGMVGFNASRSSSIYKDDCDTVQPPAYLVNIWKRTA